MKLTNTAVKNAKPKEIDGKLANNKLFDGGGLFLLVTKSGAKYWRMKYRFAGKEKLLAIGIYPEISLKQAREKRDEAKQLLSEGIDPSEHKQTIKRMGNSNSFEAVAREWHDKHKHRWTDGHQKKIIARLKNDVFPWIGQRDINSLTAPELLAVLKRIESRGALDTAHRALQTCSQIFRYAVANGKAERDPTQDLKGALPPAKSGHMATITEPKKIAQLLRDIDNYHGHFITRCALQLAPYVFVRPGELRHAEWQEIDLDEAVWKIPAEKMKMRQVHIVPLSRQAIAILEDIQPLTGRGQYVFPSIQSNTRPMSENTLNTALRRLGYGKDEMTAHGFRAMASTLLNEQGYNRDWIERQLAHSERNSIRAAYNHAEHLPERKKMMQSWADYLDGLKRGAEVIPIKRA